MNILLLKGYNNYFNRIMKREESIATYKTAVSVYYDYDSVNFNPNDGVTTELIIGSTGKGGQGEPALIPIPLAWDNNGTPDYLIAYEMVNSNAVIRSRWFIMESERTRNGQYRIALKRDVLADYNDVILNSPCFVEKGTITNKENPLLFNSEGMSFNEIKKNERAIRDNSGVAWLVGYLHKDIDSSALSGKTVGYTRPESMTGVLNPNEFDWASCIKYVDKNNTVINNPKSGALILNNATSTFKFKSAYTNEFQDAMGDPRYQDRMLFTSMNFNFDSVSNVSGYPSTSQTGFNGIDKQALNINNPTNVGMDGAAQSVGLMIASATKLEPTINNKFNTLKNDAFTSVLTTQNAITTTDAANLGSLNGAKIQYQNRIFQLTITKTQVAWTKYYTSDSSQTAANAYFQAVAGTYGVGSATYTVSVNTQNSGSNKSKFEFTGDFYTVVARELVEDETLSYDLPASSLRKNCLDAQYDMFALPINPSVLGIPVESSNLEIYNGSTKLLNINTVSDLQLAVATILSTKLGANSSGALNYDLQILPFCPMPDLPITVTSNNIKLDVSGLNGNLSDPSSPGTRDDATIPFDYQIIRGTETNNGTTTYPARGIIFFPERANFSNTVELDLSNTHEVYDTLVQQGFTLRYTGTVDEDNYPIYEYLFPIKCTDDQVDMNNLTLPSVLTSLMGVGGPLLEDGYPGFYISLNLPIQEVPATLPFSNVQVSLLAHWLYQDDAEELKISNECDFQRIVSPNYNGMFQFKKAKMQGGVHNINIDCTYKPFNPYIKLNPDFSGLYGQDWNDSTGLICGGDFSIPMLSDAMINYELQNRNYQAIFARQIQNLDVNQQLAKEQQQFTGVMNTITGGIGGAAGGAMAGAKAGPYGAIAGALAGGVLGTVGGIAGYAKDREWLERAQEEAKDYTIDMYNYQLGNIKALPQSITKSSPLSFNNKIWPILEEFSCTDEEKEVLRNKLKYDGMTIMAIGTLANYAEEGGYLKGKLIRLPLLKEDFHMADAVYQAVDKGFYKGE